MKTLNKIKFSMAITLLFLIAITSGCSSSSNNSDNSSHVNTAASVVTIVSSVSWKISYFYDSSQDDTALFTGYNFVFGSGNVLTATNGTNNYSGTWSVTDSNSSDDSISNLHFNVSFTAPVQFAKIGKSLKKRQLPLSSGMSAGEAEGQVI